MGTTRIANTQIATTSLALEGGESEESFPLSAFALLLSFI